MNGGSVFIGIMIIIAGVVFMRFHQQIANTFGGGVGSYEKYKLYALIACGVGVLWTLSIPEILVKAIASTFF